MVATLLDYLWVPILVVILAAIIRTVRQIRAGVKRAQAPQSITDHVPSRYDPPPPAPDDAEARIRQLEDRSGGATELT